MSRRDTVVGWLAAFGLFLLSRPYLGIYHDGRLYVADALAKLDPGGVGRDLMFVHDGQFGFSLYTPMLARLIAWLGPSDATMAVVAATLVLWFAAAALLVGRFLADRPPAVRWAALAFVAALPSLYGPLNVIGFGEPYATPRGLVEAAGLAGMSAYLSGRRWLGLALCGVGMLFHPIMGLCSAAAIGIALCLEDRRWLWAGLAGIAAVAVAGLLRAPLADRLVTVMNPAWRAVVEARSPILFPSLWPVEAWSRLAVQASTVAAAALLLSGASRRLALGALTAAAIGVVLVWALGDRLSLLLFLQVQSWRMLQPLAVLALASLGLLCAELPRRGPAGLFGLSLIALGWMFRDVGTLGLQLAPAGLLFVAFGDRVRFSRPALASAIALGVLAAGAGAALWLTGSGVARTLARAGTYSQAILWFSDCPSLLIALTVGVWLARGWKPPPVAIRLAGAAAIALLAVLLWDDRSTFIRARDQGRDWALVAMTEAKPGEILWLSSDVEPWLLMGRPSWFSTVQSAGVVFSRPLALELWSRAERLERAGLADRGAMRPLTVAASRPAPPDLAKVRAFCSAPDAPAWIVWPRWGDQPLKLPARDLTPNAPVDSRETVARRYAVIPCAGG